MSRFAFSLIALLLSVPPLLAATSHEGPRHVLDVRIDPDAGRLRATDRITLPVGGETPRLFVMHEALEAELLGEGRLERLETVPAEPGGVALRRWRLELLPGRRSCVLRWSGIIRHALSAKGADYARGFRESPGLIDPRGVCLSGASAWWPRFGEKELLRFSMTLRLPRDWSAVTQGHRLSRSARGGAVLRYACAAPQDEIWIVAGPWHERERRAGTVTIRSCLREADEAIAARYLETGARYLTMYERLLGSYPYGDFAVVENFWETGYGMPSFTLLGSQVLRLPFILHSSYPHEILHNWWGNGVLVDYEQGNWCEGITPYLADHLVAEQRGQGAAYRMETLQKYADYASRGRDFPLAEFRSRRSSATEAVGYGKSLMLCHMLRRRLGDRVFVQGLRRFYADFRHRLATFDDMARSFEAASGEPLGPFFDRWVRRGGAPSLRLHVDGEPRRDGDGWLVEGRIEQSQGAPFYRMGVPVALSLEGASALVTETIELAAAPFTSFSLRCDARPLRLDVDPSFDVFRLLDPAETPPAFSGAFGQKETLFVLPVGGSETERAAWEGFARALARGREAMIRREDEVEPLPEGRAVWVLGSANRHRRVLVEAARALGLAEEGTALRFGEETCPRPSIHLWACRPNGPAGAVCVAVGGEATEALAAVARKLPHYHKYSFLAFEKGEAENRIKGRWTPADSPMVATFVPGRIARLDEPRRRALAELPPAFDEARMAADLARLCDPAMEGRGAATEGIHRAADFIARAMAEAGLVEGGEAGWFQTFSARAGEPLRPVRLRNVVGRLRGRSPGESLVLCAHYDGQGFGWPDGRPADRGTLHPGAGDNGAGVAVLLELARKMAREPAPLRDVYFVAFAGEEMGRLGSRHFVETPPPGFRREGCIAAVNLDEVSGLGRGTLLALGSASAREWVHALRGVGFVTGVVVQGQAKDPGASDHRSFIEVDIPAIQLFTGARPEMHRPTDTVEGVDLAGLVSVATVTKELASWLADRREALTGVVAHPTSPGSPRPSKERRKVSMGTVPDFAHEGEGVRVGQVMEGSPAEKAGLRPGDVLVSFEGRPLGGLADLAAAMGRHVPGDRVMLAWRRKGRGMEGTVVLGGR